MKPRQPLLVYWCDMYATIVAGPRFRQLPNWYWSSSRLRLSVVIWTSYGKARVSRLPKWDGCEKRRNKSFQKVWGKLGKKSIRKKSVSSWIIVNITISWCRQIFWEFPVELLNDIMPTISCANREVEAIMIPIGNLETAIGEIGTCSAIWEIC